MAGYSFGLLLYRRLAILYNQLESFWDVSLNFLMEPVRAIQTHVVTWQRLHLPSYRDQPPDLFIRPFAWMLLPHHLLIPCDHHLPGAGAVRLVLEIHYLARCWILRFLVPTFFAPLKDWSQFRENPKLVRSWGLLDLIQMNQHWQEAEKIWHLFSLLLQLLTLYPGAFLSQLHVPTQNSEHLEIMVCAVLVLGFKWEDWLALAGHRLRPRRFCRVGEANLATICLSWLR